MFFKRYRKGVFIVVYRGKSKIEYLILKRKLHWKGWEFPKGGIEKKEDEFETVKREVKEETGLKIIEIKKYNKKGKYKYSDSLEDRKNFKGQNFKLFSTRVGNGKVKIDKNEHLDYRWCNFEKAMKLIDINMIVS